jgi:hypothetical protein
MSRSPHPFFVSPIAWHHDLASALATARESGRHVFVVHGGRTCTGTRQLVERTLAKQELSEFVDANFEPLVSDAEATAPEIATLIGTLAIKQPTPLCLYLSTDGTAVVHSTAGGRPPAVLLNDMLTARAKSAPHAHP